MPSFKNFRGTIEELGENKYVSSGEVAVVDEGTVEITELPVRTWTQNYKEDILEPMLLGTEKTPPFITLAHRSLSTLFHLSCTCVLCYSVAAQSDWQFFPFTVHYLCNI